jgi:UDPglucose--hexose-1-phosphate uridylyltransferase
LPNELRRDYILDRYAIIASARITRPTDFAVPIKVEMKGTCPFCPGNENATPPADLLIIPADGRVTYSKDNGKRAANWLVRCFPNLYPATEVTTEELPLSDYLHHLQVAYGYHEIIVESPNHEEHPSQTKVDQLRLSLEAGLIQMRRFSDDRRIRYVEYFRNHRKEAGASLSHPHSQIIAVDSIPKKIGEELHGYGKYKKTNGGCIYCEIIEKERSSARKVFENDDFFVLAPWASITPFELWILPKRHEADILKVTNTEITNLARTLRSTLGAMSKLLGDPPYNYGIHTVPKGFNYSDYHWHLEIYPKLSVWAGFELSTGIYINVTPPEIAALSLRELAENEWISLS